MKRSPYRIVRSENPDKKLIECDACGKDSEVEKRIPLKWTCCKHCGSLKIRLLKELIPKETESLLEGEAK